jgi:murein L,D-transpeptidase YcbB/YkuD
MKATYTFLILIVILSVKCTSKTSVPVFTERDVTITQENSFSELFLDSTLLEQFITSQRVEDTAANRLRNFYNSRNYQFAWFTEDGLAEQARAFWNLHNNYVQLSNDSSIIDKRLHEQMDFFIAGDTAFAEGNKQIVETELQLTGHFFDYAQYAYAGKINPDELQWHIPRKKVNAMALLDSLVTNKGQNLELWEPVNPQYTLMAKELNRYKEIDQAGGWAAISLDRKRSYKEGDSSITIKQLKRRLSAVGDFSGTDTSGIFTTELTAAIKQAQKRFGYNEDGIVNEAIVRSLNVPVKHRIEQVLINMERMRWMPKEPSGNRIVANIPEYKLHVYEASKKVFDMDIVVGTEANKTVIFNDVLKYVVFSPYWNIPRSIIRNEIQPAMRKSSNYLARKNMEQTGVSDGLPIIRQKPGGSNALGSVKFIFPNNYNIYFHDTPAKSLFGKEKRAFSHGCVRLAEPKKLAAYLLRNQPEWTSQKISEAMNASKEKWVTLKEPIPVIISYFTSWISSDGLLNFRDDIYGHDKKMAERLFEQRDPDSLTERTTFSVKNAG